MAANDERYEQVARVIDQYGTPNAQYPKDKDIDYTDLRKHLPAMGGLGTVLKNMKQKVNLSFSHLCLPSR